MKPLSLPVFLACLCCGAAPVAGNELPRPVSGTTDAALQQCSTALVEAWGFIDVAHASVWLPDCARLDWPLEPPMALRFAYVREVPGKGFRKSANAMLERNMEAETYDRLEARFRAFNRQYRDVADGDVYYMVYEADGTLTLWLNGEQLGREQGHEFASHYFRIWFGPEPFSSSLKEELLGTRRD